MLALVKEPVSEPGKVQDLGLALDQVQGRDVEQDTVQV